MLLAYRMHHQLWAEHFLKKCGIYMQARHLRFFTWLHIDRKKSKYKSFKPISAILGKSIIRYIYVQNDVFYGFYMCMKRAFWKQLNVSFVTVTVAHRGQLQTINDCCKQLKVAANNTVTANYVNLYIFLQHIQLILRSKMYPNFDAIWEIDCNKNLQFTIWFSCHLSVIRTSVSI